MSAKYSWQWQGETKWHRTLLLALKARQYKDIDCLYRRRATKRGSRVEMVFGEPLYFSGDSRDLQVLREATDEIMRAIQKLSGQEFVDMYASEAKAEILKKRNAATEKE